MHSTPHRVVDFYCVRLRMFMFSLKIMCKLCVISAEIMFQIYSTFACTELNACKSLRKQSTVEINCF